MSNKLFLFTEAELSLVNDPKTKRIGLTGDTWEEAMRFMFTKNLSTMFEKLDMKESPIGYEVKWLENQEQLSMKDLMPEEVFTIFTTHKHSDSFIEVFIKESRTFFRTT